MRRVCWIQESVYWLQMPFRFQSLCGQKFPCSEWAGWLWQSIISLSHRCPVSPPGVVPKRGTLRLCNISIRGKCWRLVPLLKRQLSFQCQCIYLCSRACAEAVERNLRDLPCTVSFIFSCTVLFPVNTGQWLTLKTCFRNPVVLSNQQPALSRARLKLSLVSDACACLCLCY